MSSKRTAAASRPSQLEREGGGQREDDDHDKEAAVYVGVPEQRVDAEDVLD
jgi:hypothetical protein